MQDILTEKGHHYYENNCFDFNADVGCTIIYISRRFEQLKGHHWLIGMHYSELKQCYCHIKWLVPYLLDWWHSYLSGKLKWFKSLNTRFASPDHVNIWSKTQGLFYAWEIRHYDQWHIIYQTTPNGGCLEKAQWGRAITHRNQFQFD